MRYFFFFLSLFLVAKTAAQDSVKISGKITNPLSDSIVVRYNTDRIAYYPQDNFAHIDKKGNFSLAFPVPHGVYTLATIIHSGKLAEIILQPGDSLAITADAAHFDSSIHYSGRGAAIENFMALHSIERGGMNQYTLKIKTHINKEPADFVNSIEEERKLEDHFLEQHKAFLPASFINYWEAYFRYYNYFFIQQYPLVHAMIKVRGYTDTIPKMNYAVVTNMPYAFNDSMLQLPPYLLYLTGVFDIKLKAAGYTYFPADTMKIRLFQDSVSRLAHRLLPPKSAEYYMAQNLYGRARNQPLAQTEFMYAGFKKQWPQSEYLPVLDEQLATLRRLAPGQPAPDFNIITPDGKSRKLSDLKGKVVYIGFWASWCKQCVGEMIKENKMKDLIKNKPLEFVYISIDDDAAADDKLMAKYKIEGLFHHSGGGWNAKEIMLYGVQSLPAYFLIDEDGNIAVQNAPGPLQSTELILAIEKLFK